MTIKITRKMRDDQQLFFIAKDGYRDEMINAYMDGYTRGMKHGEASKARKIRQVLGIAELEKKP